MRITKLIGLITAGALMLGVVACSDDGGSGSTCKDYSAVSGTASFKDDIMPIFQQSCNFSSCHSSSVPSPQEGLALGPENGIIVAQSDLDAVHSSIVGATSKRSELNLVEPGDPGGSWLLAKMDYDDASIGSCADLACSASATGCGQGMPSSSPQVTEAKRALVRSWIKAGAPNN